MQEIGNIVKTKGEDICEDVYDALIDFMNILSLRNLKLFNITFSEF